VKRRHSATQRRGEPQPDLTGCCLGLGKAPSFGSKDEAHHGIKEPRFVRYRTGIMVAGVLEPSEVGVGYQIVSDQPWFRCRHSPDS
jgi:hypothetical protein